MSDYLMPKTNTGKPQLESKPIEKPKPPTTVEEFDKLVARCMEFDKLANYITAPPPCKQRIEEQFGITRESLQGGSLKSSNNTGKIVKSALLIAGVAYVGWLVFFKK